MDEGRERAGGRRPPAMPSLASEREAEGEKYRGVASINTVGTSLADVD